MTDTREIGDVLDRNASYSIQEAAEKLAAAAGMRLVPLDWKPEGGPQIFPAMIEAMREVSAVAKLGDYKERPDGPVIYKFRGVDAVVNAAGPAFRKAGIIPVPTILTAERTPGSTRAGNWKLTTIIRIRYTFYAADGSSIVAEVEGEATDTADKGTGKAFSVGYRVALLQLLAIPTDDPDPDATRVEGDHTPLMSPALAHFIAQTVQTDSLDRLEGAYKLLTAHVAPDARVNPEDQQSTVWWELWATRYTAEVEQAAHSNDALRDLWKAVGPFGRGFRLGKTGDVNGIITQASMRWNERQKLAIDECMGQISDAETVAEVEAANQAIGAHLEAKRILVGDSLALLEVAEKKAARLRDQEAKAAQNLESWDSGDEGERGPTSTDIAIENDYHGEQGMH